MKHKLKIVFFVLLTLWLTLLTGVVVYFCFGAAVLDPRGIIGQKEYRLLITSTWLMLIVVIPVFLMTIGIAWRYRASNQKAKYSPDWDKNHWAEVIWWGLPFAIIVVLSILTWKSSHDLDPFKPIASDQKPLKVQVVALQWKWLFLYPDQKIASINFLQIPKDTPIYFEITSDAPMNSFWIPRLGGQIYAMPGMKSKLYLMADEAGDYRGSSANLSGDGFAHMHFIARASSQEEFEAWAQDNSNSQELNWASYTELVKPSILPSNLKFQLSQDDLFEQIIMKFMMPAAGGM